MAKKFYLGLSQFLNVIKLETETVSAYYQQKIKISKSSRNDKPDIFIHSCRNSEYQRTLCSQTVNTISFNNNFKIQSVERYSIKLCS